MCSLTPWSFLWRLFPVKAEVRSFLVVQHYHYGRMMTTHMYLGRDPHTVLVTGSMFVLPGALLVAALGAFWMPSDTSCPFSTPQCSQMTCLAHAPLDTSSCFSPYIFVFPFFLPISVVSSKVLEVSWEQPSFPDSPSHTITTISASNKAILLILPNAE